jgi:hypothetical protein
MICPVCVANAVMAVAGVSASTGSVTTIAVRILRWRKSARFAVASPKRWSRQETLHAAEEAAHGRAFRAAGSYVGPEGPTP